MNTRKNIMKRALLIIGAVLFANPALAGNRTIAGSFDGSESTMPASPVNCDAVPRRYRDVGTFQVSVSGDYVVSDAGNYFASGENQGEIADVVVQLYSGAFNPNAPATNRIAVVDEGSDVALSAGTEYRLVVQHWCVQIPGAFAVVIDGPGDVTGLGFNSQAHTFGEFMQGSATASFSDLGGEYRYQASAPVVLPRAGNYFFADLAWQNDQSLIVLKVYDQVFDADNPENNLLQTTTFGPASVLSIDGSGTYVFVAIDIFESVTNWQFVLFPPGSLTFNAGLTAAWGTPDVDKSGIMMEVFPETGLAFLAWFTFPAPLLVTEASGTSMDAGEEGTRTEAIIGSSDQRWMTAFGFLPGEGNFMNIAYENATGGLFNQAQPLAELDSNYGTGWIELFTCSHFALNYNLPGGLVRTTEMRRLVDDGLEYCRSFIKAAPPFPPF